MSGFHIFDPSIGLGTQVLLASALLIALGFEFVNGFHDTANAVATVIYTRSLGPRKAVVWSGICNFLGVALGGTAVAFTIIDILPADLLVSVDSARGLAMVLALLLAAIAWNVGTWYVAIPASSSHALIGSILGVGLANAALSGKQTGSGVDWHKATEVGFSLMLSPMVGFILAAILFLLLKALVHQPALYVPPPEGSKPPGWIRGTLLLTCTGVSLAHGSNDGQKGIGLVMLILIGVLPAHYALDPRHHDGDVERTVAASFEAEAIIEAHGSPDERDASVGQLAGLRDSLRGKSSFREIAAPERWRMRSDLVRLDASLKRIGKDARHRLTDDERDALRAARAGLRAPVYYAPTWVAVVVAISLGLGTMVGWKRIVVTVGERIGKSHLTYAQGAAAELVAMSTIGLADFGGLPVSTTHVLSSGVAGTMAANGTGLQWSSVRNIALAWLLTMPVCMALSGGLFLLFRKFSG
ncbi:inorganic phosphate transporter [Tundrisphaera sp. TA3]|uniref:inorganic phosphate transporter n=1 Tax=Tundrisphaera sp. TA3 TaxID=3435775 RepID=UPI003EB7BACD